MDEILRRFVEEAPVAVMVRATLARILDGPALDDLFERHARAQYTRELTFGTLVGLVAQVVFRASGSVHAAYRRRDDIPVSIAAVYDKLNRLELGLSAALVRDTAREMAGLIAELPEPPPPQAEPAGLRPRTLDGNFLAGTEHRLACLRGDGAAVLPGMALAVRDGRTGLITDVIPYEDAYTNERSVHRAVLDLVRPGDLWLADRNFCTDDYLAGIVARGGSFLIRHHAGSMLVPLGPESGPARLDDGSTLAEQAVRVGSLDCRCIIARPARPLRDGTTEVRLLTDVPADRLDAAAAAAHYRTRWRIESAFQELTTALRCELDTLGYPQAALFGFALAVVAYNVLAVIRAAMASGLGEELPAEGLSGYHLASEVASVSDGLAIAVPEPTWRSLAALPAAEFAAWLHAIARHMDWRRYRKSVRGPKKPPAVRRTRRGAHRSTARLLRQRHGPDIQRK